jgi:hypothetical protein
LPVTAIAGRSGARVVVAVEVASQDGDVGTRVALVTTLLPPSKAPVQRNAPKQLERLRLVARRAPEMPVPIPGPPPPATVEITRGDKREIEVIR